MKVTNKFLMMTLLLLSTFHFTVFADDATVSYVVWQQQPIEVALPLKENKTLRFVNPVLVGIPNNMQDDITLQNQAGEVIFYVTKPVSGRIEVKDTITGNTIILMLTTNQNASDAPLAILYKAPQESEAHAQEGFLTIPDALKGDQAYVTLTRYAEQQLYAPKRLQKNPYNIQLMDSFVTETNGNKPGMEFTSLFYDHSTVNIPWATWYGGTSYVTAVLVRNMLSSTLDLTKALPLLCGRDTGVWKAVTFFPSWQLTPAGTINDSTVAFLISTIPFQDAKKACGVANG